MIIEMGYEELDEVSGGLPILIPAAVWAAMEGIAVGGTIYATFKYAF
jgi:hypothetical protein